jgi:hypothetical protein
MNKLFPIFGVALALAACTQSPSTSSVPTTTVQSPRVELPIIAPSKPARHLGLIKVTLSGLNGQTQNLSAKQVSVQQIPNQQSPSKPGLSAKSLTLPDPTIGLAAVSFGSFTIGNRGVDGVRYVSATLKISNTGSNPVSNLSFVAASISSPESSTIAGTAVAVLSKFDGSPITDPNIAQAIKPTHHMVFDGTGASVDPKQAHMQIWSPTETAALGISGIDLLNYGYVAQNRNGGRSIPVGTDTGLVTLSVKMPLQATASDDPFSVALLLLMLEDSETRVTQSLEEQNDNASVAVRAAALGGSLGVGGVPAVVNTMVGSSYPGVGRFVCNVQTASGVTPAYLASVGVGSVTLNGSLPITINAPTTLNIEVRDTSLNVLNNIPVNSLDFTTSDPNTVVVENGLLVPKGVGSDTVATNVCGTNSNPLTVNVTGSLLANEIEANNSTGDADALYASNKKVGLNSSITGAITPLGDKDFYRLDLPSTQVVHLETFDAVGNDCFGNGMTTSLRLYDASGVQKYLDNNSGILGCSSLIVPLNAGTHYVSVEETGNNASLAAYRLRVSTATDLGDLENEANTIPPAALLETNGSIATATPVPLTTETVIFGNHQQNTDADYYAITVSAGKSLRAETIEGDSSETCESDDIDSRLTLFRADGTAIADDDDFGRGFCSKIDGSGAAPLQAGAKQLPAGTYYLRVAASSFGTTQTGPKGQFNYRLVLELR